MRSSVRRNPFTSTQKALTSGLAIAAAIMLAGCEAPPRPTIETKSSPPEWMRSDRKPNSEAKEEGPSRARVSAGQILPPPDEATADPETAAWFVRYREYTQTITTLNYKAWEAYIAPEFTWVKDKGVTLNREEALKEFAEVFKARSVKGTENILSVREKDGEVYVALFVDFAMDYGDPEPKLYKQECTDVWRKIDGKWMMVKSVDKPEPPRMTR